MSLWVYSFLSTTWLVFQTCLSVICSQFHAKYYTTKTDMLLQNYIWLIWQPTRQTIYKTSWLMSWFNILININFTWNFQIQECLKTTYFVSCLEIMTLCWLFKIDGSKTYRFFRGKSAGKLKGIDGKQLPIINQLQNHNRTHHEQAWLVPKNILFCWSWPDVPRKWANFIAINMVLVK